MDALRVFLGDLKRQGLAQGNFLGLLNVVIGRHVQKADGALVSAGCTWRELAGLLKKIRWDKDAVRELGIDPARLAPKDRGRYWLQTVAHARLDSREAVEAGDRLAVVLVNAGYIVGPGPKVTTPD